MRFLFDWCSRIMHDSVHLPEPSKEGFQIFSVFFGSIITPALSPIIKKIKNHWRLDFSNVKVSYSLIEPLIAVLLFVDCFPVIVGFAVLEIFLSKKPERYILLFIFPIKRRLRLARLELLFFFFYTLSYLVLVLERSRSQPLMRFVGFNGREIRDGTCDRGKYKTASYIPSKNNNKQPTNRRGPMCPDSIADV